MIKGGAALNTRKQMVIAKGNIITLDIKSFDYNRETGKWDVVFKSGKLFHYGYNSISVLKNPKILNPALYKVEHLGKELFKIEAIYEFNDGYRAYWHICFSNGSERSYKLDDLKVVKSCLSEEETKNIFSYLCRTAEMVSVKSEDGTNLLSKQYEKISDFVDDDTALALYLNPDEYENKKFGHSDPIFPFGCNSSQYKAVKNALENQASVIQGPPGSGKTQTILNIIANLLLSGKTVQVVSNNNSATANVLEKLSKPEYGMGFVAAPLGSNKNKEAFIEQQTGFYPDLSSWKQEDENKESIADIKNLSSEMAVVFEKKERLAIKKQQYQDLLLEKKYFDLYKNDTKCNCNKVNTAKKLTSQKILKLLNEVQDISEHREKLSVFFILKCLFIYGLFIFKGYKNNSLKLIIELQDLYYIVRETEISEEINEIETWLAEKKADELMASLIDKSMILLKQALFSKYGDKSLREIFTLDDLWKNPYKFINEYPIVLSTTFSSRSSVCKDAKFDYVIIDEASQVDVATGALALSSAKNVVIVGDSKQLSNVVTDDIGKRNDVIFDSYDINGEYRFSENSFLESACKIIHNVPQTLLREHYRCHPKIIGFCNQKFYGGQLIVMTEDNNEEDALSVYRTVKGGHVRDYYNQRQIDVVIEEVMPKITSTPEEIGVIAPYNNQVDSINKSISNSKIEVATVHKFQGREKDVIILSTVDDSIGNFVDDPNLLNVAVSRAKKSFVLVVTGNEIPEGYNIKDLISYIEYNNFAVTDSKVRSVFDFLYKEYTERRLEYLKNSKKISTVDSENLMYKLISEVLQMDEFVHYGVVVHQSLNMIIKDKQYLNAELRKFLMNRNTHLDFLIYNRSGKKPVLAVEVDGYDYHKEGTEQFKRDRKKDEILALYGIPIIRFPTNGSGEKERLIKELHGIMNQDEN